MLDHSYQRSVARMFSLGECACSAHLQQRLPNAQTSARVRRPYVVQKHDRLAAVERNYLIRKRLWVGLRPPATK
jgi:hypothetical protein